MDAWLQRQVIKRLKFGSYRSKLIFVDSCYSGMSQLSRAEIKGWKSTELNSNTNLSTNRSKQT
jgi:hypothetical protein